MAREMGGIGIWVHYEGLGSTLALCLLPIRPFPSLNSFSRGHQCSELGSGQFRSSQKTWI